MEEVFACPIRVPENLKQLQTVMNNPEEFQNYRRRESQSIHNSLETFQTIQNHLEKDFGGLQTQQGVIALRRYDLGKIFYCLVCGETVSRVPNMCPK